METTIMGYLCFKCTDALNCISAKKKALSPKEHWASLRDPNSREVARAVTAGSSGVRMVLRRTLLT